MRTNPNNRAAGRFELAGNRSILPARERENMLTAQALSPGQEQFEDYQSRVVRRRMIQYDYRHDDGELFSCVAHTLLQARRKRDRWLEARAAGAFRKRASVAKSREGMIQGLREIGLN